MLIGKKSEFAIECDVVSTIGSFVYCNFRFWIADESIGDWSEETVLGVLIHSAKTFLMYEGDRRLEQADSMSTEQLWCHIIRYAGSDDPAELLIALNGNYRARFLLHEIADDSVGTLCEVIVAEKKDGNQRLLWKCREGKELREIGLSKLMVDNVVAKFISWAESVPAAAVSVPAN